jgi:hypothetical protein
LNEVTNREWRIRAAARDIGAFESTSTNNPVGPYDLYPQPALSIASGSLSVTTAWPLFAQDFQLQQSPVLSPAIWSTAVPPSTTNATSVLDTMPIGSNSFFRLKR